MKKLVFLLLSIPSLALAISDSVWMSSNTTSAVTTQNLCVGQSFLVGTSTITTGNRAVFHGACVNTGAAGTLTIYNSSGTAVNPIAAINTAAIVPCALYDVAASSGLTYTNSATANATILYQCY